MTIITKGMGAILKTAKRKDKLLDSIRKRRNRKLPKSLRDHKVKIKGMGEVKSDKYIMDIETYDKVHQKKFKSKK
jgi:hypothetical protein